MIPAPKVSSTSSLSVFPVIFIWGQRKAIPTVPLYPFGSLNKVQLHRPSLELETSPPLLPPVFRVFKCPLFIQVFSGSLYTALAVLELIMRTRLTLCLFFRVIQAGKVLEQFKIPRGLCISYFEIGSHCIALDGLERDMQAWLASDSQRSSCFCLWSTGIKVCVIPHLSRVVCLFLFLRYEQAQKTKLRCRNQYTYFIKQIQHFAFICPAQEQFKKLKGQVLWPYLYLQCLGCRRRMIKGIVRYILNLRLAWAS